MRLEHDLLGELEVPESAYWGVHTARAVKNFNISGVSIGHYRSFVRALGYIKEASALANHELGELSTDLFEPIRQACIEVRDGKFDSEFVVDAIQGGAGTSTNMNANEVIANRALEIVGHKKGEYQFIHPLNHVNISQSTNDVYPTAIKVSLIIELNALLAEMKLLRESFAAKASEFASVIKMGRTQLQDAVPMTLGQEFSTYDITMGEDEARIREVIRLLSEINLGGTAIGTQLNTPDGYARSVTKHLSQITEHEFLLAENLIEATQDTGVFVSASSVMKRVAVKLSKIANDLRLLSSGPRAGFGEINLPPQQAGSSIMPGKVNPVIPEVVNQIAFTVIGNDLTVTMASEAGQLELNAFEPIIARSLMMSITYLRRGCATLRTLCVDGITANVEYLRMTVENSIGLVTAISPRIGYENATAVAKEAQATGKSVREVVLQMKLLTSEEFDAILGDVNRLTGRR
ncbi:aspartate ammonia-lyase [Rhodoluna lacicola]|uniref:aspartate ammonia-lyase n=1 Tax=Rhodoluna lacicola TaxID=529884 RepID=A0A060JKV4_9MICO|nr:aspartate ammonia-lyase [Rhodoluna lacicola]AIC46919.1 Aspartate ammonia-lyase [Rhodoluna lacicola]